MQSTKKLFVFFSLLIVSLSPTFSQTNYDGESLPFFLGKTTADREMKDLLTNYPFEVANPTHYLSKNGIELIFKKTVLTEINLYSKSAVFGDFTNALPRRLKFGTNAGQVRTLLGKPKEYHMGTGYCEYEFDTYFLSCWFDNGKLTQVSISLK